MITKQFVCIHLIYAAYRMELEVFYICCTLIWCTRIYRFWASVETLNAGWPFDSNIHCVRHSLFIEPALGVPFDIVAFTFALDFLLLGWWNFDSFEVIRSELPVFSIYTEISGFDPFSHNRKLIRTMCCFSFLFRFFFFGDFALKFTRCRVFFLLLFISQINS